MTTHSFKPYSDFTGSPMSFVCNSDANLNIVVTGQGRALEFWGDVDTINTNMVTGQVYSLPFVDVALGNYYDSVLLLTVDGSTRLPYAFSNSPDNVAGLSSPENKILYWADLYTFGLNNQPGNNYGGNYSFGGFATDGSQSQFKLNFSEPPTIDTNYTWLIEHVSYSSGLNSYSIGGSATVLGGQLTSTYYSNSLYNAFYLQADLDQPGYFKVTFSFVDPQFRSMLSVYHFGIDTPFLPA